LVSIESAYANSYYLLIVTFDVSPIVFEILMFNKARQESPAVADKPARRKNMLKIAPIRRAYNVFADNTGLSSFV